jgi:hypothetical protein
MMELLDATPLGDLAMLAVLWVTMQCSGGGDE